MKPSEILNEAARKIAEGEQQDTLMAIGEHREAIRALDAVKGDHLYVELAYPGTAQGAHERVMLLCFAAAVAA